MSDWEPFVAKEFSFCPSHMYNDIPVKSPAIPVFPNLLRSRFGDETGTMLMAFESVASDARVSRRDGEPLLEARDDRRGRHVEGNRIVARCEGGNDVMSTTPAAGRTAIMWMPDET